MRYYLYISDSKIDMLLPQVPGALKQRVAANLGFDLKLLSGTVSTERSTLDSSVARLHVVEAHILENEVVGAPDKPASWIEGDINGKMLAIGDYGVIFVAHGSSWVLALGGSARHLTSHASAEKMNVSLSLMPYFVDELARLDNDQPKRLLNLSEDPKDNVAGIRTLDPPWGALIDAAYADSRLPLQHFRFLAKRLASSNQGGSMMTLATPLYVALVD